MTRTASSLNRREMFSASMVIFIGLYYVIVFAMPMFQAKSINLTSHFFLVELKWLLSGLLFISGGILLFLRKHAGWVICTSTLLNFVLIVFMNIVSLSQVLRFNAYIAITIGLLVLLFMAFVFMFNRPTRLKFMVNNKSYLLTIALYLVFIAVTFWL